MSKSPDAFRTISEVAEWLGVQAHVLRFWESKFTQVKPVKRAGGRRYYRPADMLLLGGIRKLLHDDGMSIKEVQAILRDLGITHVSEMSHSLDAASPGDHAEGGSGGVFAQGSEAAAHPGPGAVPEANDSDTEIPENSAEAEEESPRPASQLPFFEQEQFDPFAESSDEDQPAPLTEAAQAESIPETISELDQEEPLLAQETADGASPDAMEAQLEVPEEHPIASDTPETLAATQDDFSTEDNQPFDEPASDPSEPEPEQIMMDLGSADAPAPEHEAEPLIEESVAQDPFAEPASLADEMTGEDELPVPEPEPLLQSEVSEDEVEPAAEVDFAPDETAPLDPVTANDQLDAELDVSAPMDDLQPAVTDELQADSMGDLQPEPQTTAETAPAEELAESDADAALQEAMDANEPREGFAPPGLPDDAEQDASAATDEPGFPPTGDIPLSEPLSETKPRIISVPDENLAAQVSLRPGLLALLSQTKELRPEVRAEVAACATELRQWLEAH